MQNLRLEYDIQHHIVLSRKNVLHHALIRTIVSTLSTPEELMNLRKKDLGRMKNGGEEFFTVKLRSAGKTRFAPLDKRTREIILSLNDRPFNMSKEEIDRIVGLYSPKDRKYNSEKLRKAVITFLRDASLFDLDLEDVKGDIVKLHAYMLDFNPLYTGMWDLDDDEVAEDFILNYVALNNIRNASIVAKELGESEERIRKIMESGKKPLLKQGKILRS
jgi:hypothetical protein